MDGEMADNNPEVNVQRRRKGAKPTTQAQAPTPPRQRQFLPKRGRRIIRRNWWIFRRQRNSRR